jgi:hypothetical protein
VAALGHEAGALVLSVVPVRTADRDNAAVIYQQAFELMQPADSWDERWTEWIRNDFVGFDPEDAKLRQFLKEHADTIRLLHHASKKPSCWFEHDYLHPSIAMTVPNLSLIRDASQLLELDARSKTAAGDHRAAVTNANTMFVMAEHAGSEPLLIGVMVSVHMDERAAETLEAVLASGDVSADDLALLNISDTISFQRLFDRSLWMEEAFALATFRDYGAPFRFTELDGGDRSPLLERFVGPLYRVFAFEEDLASYREVLGECRQLAGRPYHQVAQEWQRLGQRSEDSARGLLTHMLLPAIHRASSRSAEADAHRRLARLAVALEAALKTLVVLHVDNLNAFLALRRAVVHENDVARRPVADDVPPHICFERRDSACCLLVPGHNRPEANFHAVLVLDHQRSFARAVLGHLFGELDDMLVVLPVGDDTKLQHARCGDQSLDPFDLIHIMCRQKEFDATLSQRANDDLFAARRIEPPTKRPDQIRHREIRQFRRISSNGGVCIPPCSVANLVLDPYSAGKIHPQSRRPSGTNNGYGDQADRRHRCDAQTIQSGPHQQPRGDAQPRRDANDSQKQQAQQREARVDHHDSRERSGEPSGARLVATTLTDPRFVPLGSLETGFVHSTDCGCAATQLAGELARFKNAPQSGMLMLRDEPPFVGRNQR